MVAAVSVQKCESLIRGCRAELPPVPPVESAGLVEEGAGMLDLRPRRRTAGPGAPGATRLVVVLAGTGFLEAAGAGHSARGASGSRHSGSRGGWQVALKRTGRQTRAEDRTNRLHGA